MESDETLISNSEEMGEAGGNTVRRRTAQVPKPYFVEREGVVNRNAEQQVYAFASVQEATAYAKASK